jgi:signal peptidase I
LAAAGGPTPVWSHRLVRSTRRLGKFVITLAFEIGLTAVLFFLIQAYGFQPFRIEQTSMEPTFEPGQFVLIDKLTAAFGGYKRGDIVVFDPPATFGEPLGSNGQPVPLIKRIVGLAGETVAIHDGSTYIDGHRLSEPYRYEGLPTTATGTASTWVIPAGDVFVMGDHRTNSTDSRIFGPVPIVNIRGRVWIRYWPFDRIGILATPSY